MDAPDVGQSFLQSGEGLVLGEVAQEAQDQPGTDAQFRLGRPAGPLQAVQHRGVGDAPGGVGLGVEEEFGMHHAVGGGAAEIGHGQFEEVLLVDQGRGAGVVEVQEGLQVAEGVGRPGGLDAGPGQGHAVLLGQGEHHFRLQAAFDVQMQFGLGQGAQEGFQFHGAFSGSVGRALAQ